MEEGGREAMEEGRREVMGEGGREVMEIQEVVGSH